MEETLGENYGEEAVIILAYYYHLVAENLSVNNWKGWEKLHLAASYLAKIDSCPIAEQLSRCTEEEKANELFQDYFYQHRDFIYKLFFGRLDKSTKVEEFRGRRCCLEEWCDAREIVTYTIVTPLAHMHGGFLKFMIKAALARAFQDPDIVLSPRSLRDYHYRFEDGHIKYRDDDFDKDTFLFLAQYIPFDLSEMAQKMKQ